jgi:hypothetical protein
LETLRLARANAAKAIGSSSGKYARWVERRVFKEAKEVKPCQGGAREGGEAKEDEDKVGSATGQRCMGGGAGWRMRCPVGRPREEKEGEDVPFKQKLAREVAAKLGCGIPAEGKGQAAAKEEEEEEVRPRVKLGCGEPKEEEDKVGSAKVDRSRHGKSELGKPAKDIAEKFRSDKEAEDAPVPFKRDLQQAWLRKQRVEARAQQANEVLDDMWRLRLELDVEVGKCRKRVEEVEGQLAASAEEVKALMAGTSECQWCHWKHPGSWCHAWRARCGKGSTNQGERSLEERVNELKSDMARSHAEAKAAC